MIVHLKRFFVGVSLVLLATSVAAQGYPNKPIRWIVPYAAGGGTDLVARIIAAELSRNLGQQVLIENRPGAATIIGAEAAAKSAPDGYTILTGDNGSLIFNPVLYKKLPYDVDKDFAPVSLIAKFPLMLVVNPKVVPAASVGELLSLAKAQPGKINYASPGAGSPQHLAMELFRDRTGAVLEHVAYKGTAPLTQDLLAERIGVTFMGIATGLPQVRSGKLRALAIAEQQRLAVLPDVPTFAESGVSGVVAYAWQGVVVPAATSKEIVARLQEEIGKVLRSPEVIKRFADAGVEPLTSTPEEFARLIKADSATWGSLIRSRGISLEQ